MTNVKQYDVPASHHNRYGLPEYVVTRTKSQPLTQDDVLFHISRIQDNMSYYNQNKKNKRKKKRRKKKKNKHKDKDKVRNRSIKQRTSSLDDIV